MTDTSRATFRRTHCGAGVQDPEESLVEIIAGRFAFWPEMIRAYVRGTASFELIEEIREKVCPEASRQSALIGIVKAWPDPLILVRAELGREGRALQQGRFGFQDSPKPVLRAVHVTPSEMAKARGFTIHQNMRVPEESVIQRVFEAGSGFDEAGEDLSCWESSDGTKLPPTKATVSARHSWGGVDALITPRTARKSTES